MRTSTKLLAAGAALFLGAACDDEYKILSPTAAKETYTVQLTGAAERPTPVTTSATGSAVITIENENYIRYQILVQGIDSVTQGHFHAGDASAAGPVMHFVYAGPTTRTGVSGVMRVGDIARTSAFSGAFTFDSLKTRIRAGTTYLNLHTRRNGPGEIRGQVVKQQ
jgi:hypothetical protein